MSKRFLSGALIIFVSAALSSCWGAAELENRAYVNALAVDAYERGTGAVTFDNKKGDPRYILSASMPTEAVLLGEGGAEGGGKSVLLSAGETVPTAMGLLGAETSRKPYFGHVKAVVLGKSVLEDKALMRECVDALERNRELGRKVIITATDGGARALLSAETEGEPLFGMYMNRVYKNRRSIAGASFRLNLDGLASGLAEDGCAVIPKVSRAGKGLKLSGAALIKDYKLAGWLDDGQTRGVMWVRGLGEGASVVLKHSNEYFPVFISRSKGRMAFEVNEGHIVCRVNLEADGSIEGSKQQGGTEQGLMAELTLACESVIEKEAAEAFEAMRSKGVDGLAVKQELRKRWPDIYEAIEGDWDSAYKAMRFEPSARVRITSAGSIRL